MARVGGGVKKFPKGKSGNPYGRPIRLAEIRQALDDERDPEKFRKLMRALYERALADDNDAAKIWLRYICPDDQGLPDLSDAPDYVLMWFANRSRPNVPTEKPPADEGPSN